MSEQKTVCCHPECPYNNCNLNQCHIDIDDDVLYVDALFYAKKKCGSYKLGDCIKWSRVVIYGKK